MTLDVLYRDEHCVALDKPSGLAVHRGWARDDDTLLTRARTLLGQWVYPVHRLDRGASGVVVMALSPTAAAWLAQRLRDGEMEKRYLALVRGVPPDELLIDHPIPRHGRSGERVPAQTSIHLLGQAGRYALVEAIPLTGRTHQIRRHLKHIGHPLIGDVTYGKGEHNRHFRKVHGLHRLALHAVALTFPCPFEGAPVHVTAPPGGALGDTLGALGLL